MTRHQPLSGDSQWQGQGTAQTHSDPSPEGAAASLDPHLNVSRAIGGTFNFSCDNWIFFSINLAV